MTVNIAIVEDARDDMDRLVGYLGEFAKANGHEFKISTFAEPYSFLDSYTPVYDIIFLDIELGSENGIEVARKMRKKDGEVMLIFETNIAKYATQGYEVDASDYLLKPITYPMLSLRLTKVIRYIEDSRFDGDLIVKTPNGYRRVSINKILYMESRGHSIFFHMTYGDFEGRDSLSSLEKKLPRDQFARCNNCFLVNLSMVWGMDKNECLVGSDRLQVSRPKKRQFVDKLSTFMTSDRYTLKNKP